MARNRVVRNGRRGWRSHGFAARCVSAKSALSLNGKNDVQPFYYMTDASAVSSFPARRARTRPRCGTVGEPADWPSCAANLIAYRRCDARPADAARGCCRARRAGRQASRLPSGKREASIIRRLLSRHQGALPPVSLVRIWRELLAGTTSMQGGFSLAVGDGEPDGAVTRLAREHFGALTPLRAYGHAWSRLWRMSARAAHRWRCCRFLRMASVLVDVTDTSRAAACM